MDKDAFSDVLAVEFVAGGAVEFVAVVFTGVSNAVPLVVMAPDASTMTVVVAAVVVVVVVSSAPVRSPHQEGASVVVLDAFVVLMVVIVVVVMVVVVVVVVVVVSPMNKSVSAICPSKSLDADVPARMLVAFFKRRSSPPTPAASFVDLVCVTPSMVSSTV